MPVFADSACDKDLHTAGQRCAAHWPRLSEHDRRIEYSRTSANTQRGEKHDNWVPHCESVETDCLQFEHWHCNAALQ